MKKVCYLMASLVICGLCVILFKNHHSLSDLPKASSDNRTIELADSYSNYNHTIVVFDLNKFIPSLSSSRIKYDYLKAAFAIQGLVNRKQPLLYYIYDSTGFQYNGKEMDQAWLDELLSDSNAFKGYSKKTLNSFDEVINLAKNLGVINGYVLWDDNIPATSNVASTIAGVENLIPIRYDTTENSCYNTLAVSGKIGSEKRNLVGKFSSKNEAYLWAKKEYLDTKKTNSSLIGYIRDAWTPKCGEGACFMESYAPTSLKPNEEREVYVTVLNNTPNETWTSGGNYRIAAASSGGNGFKVTGATYGFEQGDNPAQARIYLNPSKPVKPGEKATIKIIIKAPSTQGTYYLKLGLVHDGVAWLSGELSVQITVSNSSSYNKVIEHYGSYDAIMGGLFNAGLNNSDYLIQNKAFFFDLSPDETIAPIDDRKQKVGTDVSTLKAILKQLSTNNGNNLFTVNGFVPWYAKYCNYRDSTSSIDPVHSEWKMVDIISSYGGITDADAMSPAGLTNASIFDYVKLNSNLRQNNDKELIKNGTVVKEVYDPNTLYFVLFMGDYDGGSWTSGVLPSKFGDYARSNARYPLAWGVAANLSNRIPNVYNWLYKNQTANDYFVAGDNGSGYLDPLVYNNLSKWTNHNIEMYRRFDLDITGFLLSAERKITQNIQNEYVKISPVLVGYQSSGIVSNKVGNTPFVWVNNTAGANYSDSQALAEDIYKNALEKSPNKNFVWVRTVQISRSVAYDAIDKVYKMAYANNKKVKIVDPYTMAYLYNNKPTSYKGCYTDGKTRKWIESSSIPSGYTYVSGIGSKNECEKEVHTVSTVKGDIDGDNKVTPLDYLLVKKHMIGMVTLTKEQYTKADFNGDNQITPLDYIEIKKIMLGLSS